MQAAGLEAGDERRPGREEHAIQREVAGAAAGAVVRLQHERAGAVAGGKRRRRRPPMPA
ncbi:MAG: hypothetical protein U0531_19405 [Dehalococcoidia bacterium]